MPSIFFGHGNPMNAIQTNGYTKAWAEIGRSIPKPKGILCISAHWYISELAVTAMAEPRTIHDFGGFPKELFDVEYPAPGSPGLAARVEELLEGEVAMDTSQWGLDHGTWSVLCHVFPDADIPVVQLSIDRRHTPKWHYDFARKLDPLRDEGVLIVGSGNLVHNLRLFLWGSESAEPFDWALRFDKTGRDLILADVHESLIDYPSLGNDAMLSVPTPEHYLPLLYVLALKRKSDKITFPVSGFDGGAISMTSVRVG